MVYKLRSRYFISSARIMVSIKQEEQEVTFYTAPPPPPRDLISSQTVSPEDEKMKRLSERCGFSS